VSLAIDEFPILFIAAACAEGETVLRGARELRVKESDRIAVVAEGLKRLGVDARETPDGMSIRGSRISGGEVDSRGDHRVAMAFAMAGAGAEGAVTVRDCENVNTSFPGFAELAAGAGLSIQSARPHDLVRDNAPRRSGTGPDPGWSRRLGQGHRRPALGQPPGVAFSG
jgi:3-phosphoshikimate 1-carboxyvinyltransferase